MSTATAQLPEKSRAMPRALAAVTAALVVVFYYYRETVASMVAIWQSSETYAHGWIILPIALWLLWRERDCVLRIEPRFNPLGLLAMAAVVLLWVAADIIDAQVIKHLTLVLMVGATVLTLLGWRAARQMAFPLAFLLFAVPVGEILVPLLMEFTASFTVAAIQLTGVPVFRDGMFFSLPSGDFEVAVACSGIRYLIASIALGTLYAYLSFSSNMKRFLFIGLAALVPIVANGVRAYLIVMIAHLSGMKLAVGIDHFIYGWVFFGLVMFVLFLIGSRFADEAHPVLVGGGNRRPVSIGVLGAATMVLVAIAISVPTAAGALRESGEKQVVVTSLPQARGAWSGPLPPGIDYQPNYRGASSRHAARYAGPDGDVHVFIDYYAAAETDGELISETNRIRTREWVREDVADRRHLAAIDAMVLETPLRRRANRLLVWNWFEVNGAPSVSGIVVKLRKLRDTLLGKHSGSALVAIAALERDTLDDARELLEDFVVTHWDALRECLYDDGGSGAPCAQP